MKRTDGTNRILAMSRKLNESSVFKNVISDLDEIIGDLDLILNDRIGDVCMEIEKAYMEDSASEPEMPKPMEAKALKAIDYCDGAMKQLEALKKLLHSAKI